MIEKTSTDQLNSMVPDICTGEATPPPIDSLDLRLEQIERLKQIAFEFGSNPDT